MQLKPEPSRAVDWENPPPPEERTDNPASPPFSTGSYPEPFATKARNALPAAAGSHCYDGKRHGVGGVKTRETRDIVIGGNGQIHVYR
jgi:hypothetical protein